MKSNQKGFTLIEGLLITIIILIIGSVGWYVWHSNKVANDNLNASSQSSLSATNAKVNKEVANQDVWQTYCDEQSQTCLKYPKTWNEVPGFGNQGAVISDSTVFSTVNENPNPGNCNTNPQGSTGQFHVISVSNVKNPNLKLKVIGGYELSKLNGVAVYNPSYILVSDDFVAQYKVKTRSTVTMPLAWTCYNYGVINGEASAQPIGKQFNSTEKEASSWFNTPGAKDGLQILQSVTSKL